MTKKHKKTAFSEIVFLIILAVAIVISSGYAQDIELKLGIIYYVEQPVEDTAAQTSALPSADGDKSMSVHFVDVGQADCTIIELPDGKTAIIDGGDSKKAVKADIFDFIAETLPNDFAYFDYCILTHTDEDHCGSLDDVLLSYPARVCYRPNVETNYDGYDDPGKADLTAGAAAKASKSYKNAIDAMYKANDDFTPVVHVTDPDSESCIIYGGADDDVYTLEFYTPLSDSYEDGNDYSPIMILNYRGYMFAMSGDAEKVNEAEFVQKTEDAKTDGVTDKYDIFTDEFSVNVIKAGHHGSGTSTSKAYLDAITTVDGAKEAFYVISCGLNNQYGHPHEVTLNRLEDMGVPQDHILRTDLSGDITLTVKADAAGAYKLYYGQTETGAQPGDLPVLPATAQPQPSQQTEKVLVRKKLGGIELTWNLVAWVCFAVIAVIIAVHIYLMYSGDKRDDEERKSKKKSRKGGKR